MHSRGLSRRGGEFLRLRLGGARFEDGSIPLDILGELAALRELVLEVARRRFLKEHPGRQRSPRWFNRIDLNLTSIDRGSAVPVISLVPDEPFSDVVPFQYLHFYEQARDDITHVIGAAEYSESPVANGHFPNHCLAFFNRIGRSLRDDEWIDLHAPSGGESVRLTKQSRLRLIQWSSIAEASQEVTLRGVVSEADQARMTFELQPVYGPKVGGPIPDGYLGTVVEALARYDSGERVLVEGVGRWDRNNRLSGLESVKRISQLAPLDVPARLDEFRQLRDGWLEEDGQAPDHAGLDWLATSFDRYYPDDVVLPHSFPTPKGGVELEWSLGSQSVVVEVNLETRRGDWLRFDKASDEEDSRILRLSDSASWEWIAAEIRRLSGSSE